MIEKSRLGLIYIIVLIILSYFPNDVSAQWFSQKIILQPGWNSIFIEGEPIPNFCDDIFKDSPVESVWYYNNILTGIQYIYDPVEVVEHRPEWMVYYPPTSKNRNAADLFKLIGKQAYLIKVQGSQPFELELTCRPMKKSITWIQDAKIFIGFIIDENNPPTFAKFFESSSAHSGQPIFRLNQETGKWEQIAKPDVTKMKRGEGLWIHTKGASKWQGPLEIDSDIGYGLEFGSDIAEIKLSVKNVMKNSTSVKFSILPSLPPPIEADEDITPLAGSVPISYFIIDFNKKILDWFPLENSYTIQVNSKKEKPVRFKVRRNELSAPSGETADYRKCLYQSVLKVSDENGWADYIPVSTNPSSAMDVFKKKSGKAKDSLPPNMPYNLREGLWVGKADIDAVSEANSSTDIVTPKKAATVFSFPIIMHIDENDKARFLNEVFVMKKPAVMRDDPNKPGETILVEPAKNMFLTDPKLISQYEGIVSADGGKIGKRISTAAFATSPTNATQTAKFHNDKLISTQFPVDLHNITGTTSPTLSCIITLDYDDPLNPFKHKYHPDHDNFNLRFDGMLDEGQESYQVSRTVIFEWSAEDPYNRTSIAGWGDTIVGGVYKETIEGIHRNQIFVSGKFQFKWVAEGDLINSK